MVLPVCRGRLLDRELGSGGAGKCTAEHVRLFESGWDMVGLKRVVYLTKERLNAAGVGLGCWIHGLHVTISHML